MISNSCQVITSRSQVIACRSQVSSNNTVDITIIYFNTGKIISTGFKLFTTIKERIIVKLSSRQAGMQASVYSSKAK